MFTHQQLVTEINGLQKFAYKMTRNMADAEDLLQATLLRALEKKHLFQTDTNLFKWTSKIMYNLFVTDYRRRQRFETKYDPESFINERGVDGDQEVKVNLSDVSHAMAQLSDDHRDILVMVSVQGMSYQDVAGTLNIPVGTVRSRLSRAREQLQQLLGNQTKERGLDEEAPFYSRAA